MPECIPDGFEWKDPSKIQSGEVFCLLDHWRLRQDEGHDPLIWVLMCALFKDAANAAIWVRTTLQARYLEPIDSDKEMFVLPSSDDIDAEEESHRQDDTSGHSAQPHVSVDDRQSASLESPNSDIDVDDRDSMLSGEFPYSQFVFTLSSIYCALLLEHSNEHSLSGPYNNPTMSNSGV
jgi:hypothetical protein